MVKVAYLAMSNDPRYGGGYWGRGVTPEEAKKMCFKSGGSKKRYTLYKMTWDINTLRDGSIATEEERIERDNFNPYVDDMGYICYHGTKEVIEEVK